MKTILPTILILLQCPADASDNIPVLRGAIRHADSYLQRSDYWSQFKHAINVYNNDLSPIIDAAAKDDSIIILCIYDYSDVQYQRCAAGGNPGTYTCGLWQTFHAMSVSPISRLSGEQMFDSLGQFIKFFFTCTVCQEHFLGMMASVDHTTVQSQDDFIVWLWESHNEVNERLREEELDAGTFNVDRPKGLFPSPDVCENCLDDREGNYVGPYVGEHQRILPFMDQFYGEDLV